MGGDASFSSSNMRFCRMVWSVAREVSLSGHLLPAPVAEHMAPFITRPKEGEKNYLAGVQEALQWCRKGLMPQVCLP